MQTATLLAHLAGRVGLPSPERMLGLTWTCGGSNFERHTPRNHSAASNCCPEKLLQNRSRETEFASSEAGEPVQYFTSKSAVFDWTVPVQKRTRRMPGVSRLMNVGPLPSNREVTR